MKFSKQQRTISTPCINEIGLADLSYIFNLSNIYKETYLFYRYNLYNISNLPILPIQADRIIGRLGLVLMFLDFAIIKAFIKAFKSLLSFKARKEEREADWPRIEKKTRNRKENDGERK